MGRSRKELHYGVRGGNGRVIRQSIPDRTSKAARPWNHPQVVQASDNYGVQFKSYKGVHEYENKIEDMGSLNKDERMTCRDCGKFHSEHEDHI